MGQQVRDDHELLRGIGLNFAEAAMLCDALKALWLSPEFTERVWRELRGVIRRDGLAEKWGTDTDTVVDRLCKLGCAEATALVRAALRFWDRRDEPTASSLRELGLIAVTMLKSVVPALEEDKLPSPGES
jgi:hypothetical protein